MNKPKPLDGKRNKLLYGMVVYTQEDIKSACEFYLRYKDRPRKLWVENKDNKEYLKQLTKIFVMNPTPNILIRFDNYNEWLFKLSFKDVLGEDKNGNKYMDKRKR